MASTSPPPAPKYVTRFSEKEVGCFKATFDQIDTDSNGLIQRGEMNEFLKRINKNTKYIEVIFKVFDVDHDDALNMQEFLNFLSAGHDIENDPRQLYKLIFNVIDSDKSGTLSIEEMLEFGKLCGVEMTLEDAKAEEANIDKNGSGELDFNELCTAFGL